MTDEERKANIDSLYTAQAGMFGPYVTLPKYFPDDKSIKDFDKEIPNVILPIIENLETMKDMDDTVFAKWKIADIPMMVVAGGLGTLSSVLLKDFFAGLHDDWGKTSTSNGGHSGENIDWVPGAKQPGGFGHRWKFGHDLFNPFEVDWQQYIEIGKQSGGFIPAWLKAPFYWLKHLFHDTFSKEGLPLPGNSLLRLFLNPADPTTRQILQILGTIKMRDVAGAGITNIVMGAYVWGTEKDLKRVVSKPNYRGFSLMLGANLITLLSGLLIPPPATSFNWGTVPVICYYSFQLLKLEKEVRRQLKERDAVLDRNQDILLKNGVIISNAILMNDEYFEEFERYETDIVNFYDETIAKHEFLKKEMSFEGV